jgi:hypothetical protein
MASVLKDCYTAIMFKKAEKPKPKPSHPAIERARQVTKLLDSAITIPIIRKKIGLDPILGLLPVGGDLISALLAAYLVWVAVELGLPRPVIIRMTVNILVDCAIGMVPVVGDVADAMWKSNQWNLKLLEEAYQQQTGIGVIYTPAGQPIIDVVVERATG